MQAVNVESVLWLAQAFTPGMAERGFGRIVFITSDTVWSPPSPVLLPYIASKEALLAIMRTLAVTLGPDGIAVSAVAPGLTDTPPARAVNTAEVFDATVAQQALKRRLAPDDTAAAVAYLVSGRRRGAGQSDDEKAATSRIRGTGCYLAAARGTVGPVEPRTTSSGWKTRPL